MTLCPSLTELANQERDAITAADEIDYARIGWYCFPTIGKRPLAGSHGWRDATRDEARIRAWWAAHPKASVSIACSPSKLIAIDVDAHRGGEETAQRVLAIPIPPHPWMQTPHGGRKLIFRAPLLSIIRSKTDGLGPGIDVLATMFVAPPSPGYSWAASPIEVEPPYVPYWLWKLLPKVAVNRPLRARSTRSIPFRLEDVLPFLERLRGSSVRGYTARCPNHDDRSPSFSITTGSDGQPLFHCFAGCPSVELIAALSALARRRGAP